jgi:hypothetical protein
LLPDESQQALGQDRSVDGNVQCYRLYGGEPGIIAAEHFLDLGAVIERRCGVRLAECLLCI